MKRRSIRLASGAMRGRTLPVEAGVRPTSSRVREALVDSWRHRLADASVLDLFAGTGAVGLEALGHGAADLVGVEADRRVAAALEGSYRRLAPERADAVAATLPRELSRATSGRRFELVFADPPYDFDAFETLLASCAGLLAAGGELTVEHPTRRALPESAGDLERSRQRRYGETSLSFYRPRGGEER